LQGDRLKTRAGLGPEGVPDELFPAEPVTAWLERCDSAALERVAPFVDAVSLTLVSHIEAIVRRLQPDAEPEAVLTGFLASLEACRQRGIPVEVEVPLATENASMLPETVAWIAQEKPAAVRVVPFPARVASDRTVDAYSCFSERYLARIAQLCEQAAGDVRFVWEPRAGQTFGLARLPGFCEEVWGRIRIHRSGRVEPCMYAASGELTLGKIGNRRSLVDVWRGVNAQDLRRAHLSWDYPAPCTTCPRTVGTQPPGASAFVERFLADVVGARELAALEPLTPGLIARFGEPPVLRMHRPEREVRAWHVALALGGESDRLRTFGVECVPEGARVLRLSFPEDAWQEMEPDIGYWWAAFAETADGSWVGMQRPHCLVRHQALPRMPRSRLHYPSPNGEVATESVARATGFLKAEYEALIERVRSAVSGAVPAGSICAIATKGDDRFLDLEGSAGWHFPRGEDGEYAGYNPPDGRWAVAHLEELRAAGADYVVIPATSFWWREHYAELAAYLSNSGTPVLEERDTCLIVGLAPWEDEV
jgi:hypothetical protein